MDQLQRKVPRKFDTDYTLTNEGGVSVGVYDVIANGKGNYNGMATKQFSIISKGIGSFDVTLSTEQVVYTGSEHRPTVTVKDGDKTLTPGSEFSVSYTDNTNAGTATVTITGQGEYSGTTTKTFIIKPKPLTEDMVFLSSTSYTYNTLQQKPTVTVSDQSFLTANDYTLTNDGGINHGDYDVVVIGRNNYTGVITKQFTIKPLSIETAKVVLYEIVRHTRELRLHWKQEPISLLRNKQVMTPQTMTPCWERHTTDSFTTITPTLEQLRLQPLVRVVTTLWPMLISRLLQRILPITTIL